MTDSLRGTLAMLAAAFVGTASFVQPQTLAVALLVVAIVAATLAATGGDWEAPIPADRLYRIVARFLVAIGILLFSALLRSLVDPDSAAAWVAWIVLCSAVGLSAFGMLVDGWGSKASVAFFIFYSLAITWVLVLTSSDAPSIDVIQFQQGAAAAIYDGVNPYAIRFPDLYGIQSSIFYGVGVSVDGVLNFGFPYPPLSLVLILPFDWLLSDFRVAHALAIVGAGILMALIARNAQSRGAAAAFLLTSPVLFVLKFGWTEPLAVLFAIAIVYVRVRRRNGASFMIGLLVSVKQYGVLFLPASLLLMDRPWRMRPIVTHFAKAGAVVVVTTLPFLLWNPEAFIRSVVELQFLQPFRADSIALPAVYASYFGEPSRIASIVLPLVVFGLVTVVTLRRTPTGAQGFALASGLTLMVVFAFSKQAFENYYLLVAALLFAGAASGGVDTAGEDGHSHDSSRVSNEGRVSGA